VSPPVACRFRVSADLPAELVGAHRGLPGFSISATRFYLGARLQTEELASSVRSAGSLACPPVPLTDCWAVAMWEGGTR